MKSPFTPEEHQRIDAAMAAIERDSTLQTFASS